MTFVATRQHVLNRGTPPESFLEELVAWGKTAPDEIFAPNDLSDIYSSVHNTLGPYPDNHYRRCCMLEVMRVLAGFESSWNWNEGIDTNNPNRGEPRSQEAGAWQVSADSMALSPVLKALAIAKVGSNDPLMFQRSMKVNHPLAMEYIARLLRITTHENGPVVRHEIDPWLRRNSVNEFASLLA
jgi:hypothetical protein